jgi:DNA invertase Pin-like site-specific DNA recombinase
MSLEHKPILRCAIYTRKSSEEGLEQSFNSLDAQRESSEAFILSQRQEGWRVIPTRYDDGGYSGGTMERPGLKRLLADVEANKVNVIVVYKVDRLTRSLSDFAKIVQALDARGVSFCIRHPAVQHDLLDGTAHAQHSALVRTIRKRSHGREDSGQNRRFEEERNVDGRPRATRLRPGRT